MKKTQTFSISGMHCTSCAISIDLDLEELNGILSSQTHYAKQQTIVTFDDGKITEQDILNQIQKTGYKASVIR